VAVRAMQNIEYIETLSEEKLNDAIANIVVLTWPRFAGRVFDYGCP